MKGRVKHKMAPTLLDLEHIKNVKEAMAPFKASGMELGKQPVTNFHDETGSGRQTRLTILGEGMVVRTFRDHTTVSYLEKSNGKSKRHRRR